MTTFKADLPRAAAVQIGALAALMALAGPALAETSATLTPSLSPDRLGAKGALTVTIHYSGGEFGVPSPVLRSVIKFPAGLNIEIPSLRSCSPARLKARGPRGCPVQSHIGTGHALVEARAGSQIISEQIKLEAFLGPFQNLQPTFEVFGQGYTPIERRVALLGSVIPGSAPYGEEIVMRIPPVPTLPLEPDASMVALTLTVGTAARHPAADADTVAVPSKCPSGGFPFAGEFTYADGTSSSALATVHCPS